MEQQKTSLQELICSLNACELQSLILKLSENDALLSDRIIGIIRHLFPDMLIWVLYRNQLSFSLMNHKEKVGQPGLEPGTSGL